MRYASKYSNKTGKLQVQGHIRNHIRKSFMILILNLLYQKNEKTKKKTKIEVARVVEFNFENFQRLMPFFNLLLDKLRKETFSAVMLFVSADKQTNRKLRFFSIQLLSRTICFCHFGSGVKITWLVHC